MGNPSVMTAATLLRTGLPPLCQLLPGLSPPVLLSPGQPIQYAHSTCEAGVAELHIQDTLPEDDGTYTCLAENTVGQVSCSARVTVQGRSLWAALCVGRNTFPANTSALEKGHRT